MSGSLEKHSTWLALVQLAAEASQESNRIRQLVSDAVCVADSSDVSEDIYSAMGESLSSLPRHADEMCSRLDRLNYILASISKDRLSERATMDDRAQVQRAFGKSAALRVALQWLVADKNPALGFPGGPCHVINRIDQEVKNPRLRAELIEDVERGLKMENRDAAKVYDLEVLRGPTKRFSRMIILPHAQYRMDQRGVTVPEVRLFFKHFNTEWGVMKSRGDYLAKAWEQDMRRGEPIRWVDPKTRLVVVFAKDGDTAVRVITTYWEGQPDPRPVSEESCRL